MPSETAAPRRLVLASGHRRIDVVVAADRQVRDVLAAVDIEWDASRHAVVAGAGGEVELTTSVESLSDGALLMLVDMRAADRREARGRRDPDSSAGLLPWLALAVGLAASAVALLRLDGALGGVGTTTGLVAAAGAGLVALLLASVAALDPTRPAVDMVMVVLAAAAFAFAAGALAVPNTAGAVHLGVLVGTIGVVVVAAWTGMLAATAQTRGVAGIVGGIGLVFAAIWGVTLTLQWSPVTAAAISLGVVVPAVRAMPTFMLDVAEGYSINYKHFMSSRWTVRGSVPNDPGPLTKDSIDNLVGRASVRYVVGSGVLVALAPLFGVFVAPAVAHPSMWVRIGVIATFACVALALVLGARRANNAVLTWVPRVAAAVLTLELLVALFATAGEVALIVAVAVLLFAGVLTSALIVPIAKGARSLSASRIADVVEAAAVALSLPAAMLAGDVLAAMRTVGSS